MALSRSAAVRMMRQRLVVLGLGDDVVDQLEGADVGPTDAVHRQWLIAADRHELDAHAALAEAVQIVVGECGERRRLTGTATAPEIHRDVAMAVDDRELVVQLLRPREAVGSDRHAAALIMSATRSPSIMQVRLGLFRM